MDIPTGLDVGVLYLPYLTHETTVFSSRARVVNPAPLGLSSCLQRSC